MGAAARGLIDPRDRGVVRHSIDPRAQRASTVIASEAAPQRDVNVLQQVAPCLGVAFVAAGQPLERRAERARRLGIAFLLALAPDGIAHSGQIVAGRGHS